MEHFLEQVAWPEAQLPLVRSNKAAPPEPTPMQKVMVGEKVNLPEVDVGIIESIEAMSTEEHKKKVAEEANLKVLTLSTKEVQRKAVEEATIFVFDGEIVPKEVIIVSIQA
ncbi:hypothetical protein JHK82_040154 [Glycine max]|nr:hypothetical protein JHK82_040154 [Glycine max]